MKLTNSYIFIPKIKESSESNKIVIKTPITNIFKNFFNAQPDSCLLGEIEDNPEKLSKEILDKYNKTIRGSFVHTINEKDIDIDIDIDVYYKFVKADDIFYLDITINNIKNRIIKCFEDFNNIFLTKNEFTRDYITIISYDCVSEYYCNKIYPVLNAFERSFRKLLFLIFTSQFKELYFESTAPQSMIDGAKEKIKGKSQIYRIQNYFYSLDIGTLRSYLFDKNWTSIEEKKKEKILNKDLSKISQEELKNIIKNIEPKSNWDRFFKNKGFAENIDDTMKKINDLRNIVAHNKIMNKNDYETLLKLLKENIKVINKAINITESVDFRIINRNKKIEVIENCAKIVSQAFNNINTSFYSSNLEKIAIMLNEILKSSNIYKYQNIEEEVTKIINNDTKE